MAFQISKISNTFTWSDASNFNGFAVIGIVLPTSGGVNWPYPSTENSPETRFPIWSVIPIENGVANQNVGLLYTADLNPPNTKYGWYAYDRAFKQVAGPSATFTVTAATTSLPSLTLTAPSAGSVVPTPS